MKNKRSLLVLGLFALVLVLGVGYAVVNEVGLTIGGDAGVKSTNLKVKFDATEGKTTTSKSANSEATVDASVTNDTTATIDVTNMTFVGEEVTATYTILNEEVDLDAAIKAVVTTGNTDYFTVSTDWTTKTVGKSSSTTITVTVKLEKLPIESDDSKTTFLVDLTATASQPTA